MAEFDISHTVTQMQVHLVARQQCGKPREYRKQRRSNPSGSYLDSYEILVIKVSRHGLVKITVYLCYETQNGRAAVYIIDDWLSSVNGM